MKGRKIEDQVMLAKFLLNYVEVAEEDGVIIALDQEKVYDRINHDYSRGQSNTAYRLACEQLFFS
jgi:hypothetical protein